jgi:hypothetical protein
VILHGNPIDDRIGPQWQSIEDWIRVGHMLSGF